MVERPIADDLIASQILKHTFTADISPILATARLRSGAIAPMKTYRASGYRDRKANERTAVTAAGGGIA